MDQLGDWLPRISVQGRRGWVGGKVGSESVLSTEHFCLFGSVTVSGP